MPHVSPFDASLTAAVPPAVPEHLRHARCLADCVTPETNRYGKPTTIDWPAEEGEAPCSVRSKCAPFVTACLKRAYPGIDFEAWMDSTSPNSARYHEAIVAADHFLPIVKVAAIRPGDVMAIEHQTASSSGHTTIVDALPVPRVARKPFIAETTQYSIDVIDVTSSAHGTTDSRLSGDSDDEGVGRGTMRLYVDGIGRIVGHTWSMKSSSYHSQAERAIAFGRYIPAAV